MNKVILMGRLARDVDLRQTPSGISVARFTIAVNRRFAAKDAQQQADFISCVAWRQTGEFISRYFHKGSMIAVVGSIQTRSWDGQDGKRQYATDVVVDEAYFTGSKAETGAGGNSNYGGNNYGGNNYGGYNNNNASYGGGYQNNSYQAPVQQPAPQADDAFGGFDDGGFMDIDGSEDDLPF